MSNGRPFRPTNHPRAGYAKSGTFQGPMGRARLATMQGPAVTSERLRRAHSACSGVGRG